MNINETYREISSFWENIFPILIAHIIFLFIYKYIFQKISFKTKIQDYIKGSNYKSTKELLNEFELWSKVPLLLLISLLAYLSLFNSLINFTWSIDLPPFAISYSKEEFMQEYRNEEDILTIIMYSKDEVDSYEATNQLLGKYLEDYKKIHPEKYDDMVGWVERTLQMQRRNYELTIIIIAAIIIVSVVKSRKAKHQTFLKIAAVLTAVIFILLFQRYQIEQTIEEAFVGELYFVKSELLIDSEIDPLLTEQQVKNIQNKLNEEKSREYETFWISRSVEKNGLLKFILGDRKLYSED